MTATVRLPGSAAVWVAMGLCLAWIAIPLDDAQAQQRGLNVTKGCFGPDGATSTSANPKAPGDFIDCEITATHNDGFGDPTLIRNPPADAVDVVELSGGDCSVDLQPRLVAVTGNAVCAGALTFPCLVCADGDTDIDAETGLRCPGVGEEGALSFRHDDVCQIPAALPADGKIDDTATVTGEVVCGQDTPSAPCPGADGLPLSGSPSSVTFVEADIEFDKVCRDPADPSQTLVTFANVPAEGCVVEDELYLGLEVCPADLDDPSVARGTGVSLGAPVGVSGTGTVGFLLPADLEGAACNVARLVCDDLIVAQAADECLSGENFKCYTAKFDPRGPRFSRQEVVLQDQFRTTEARVIQPYELCTPVDKNGDGIINEAAHLMCYKIIDGGPRGRETVAVTDQFGTERMIASNGRTLCVPAIKNCDPEDESCAEQLRVLQAELNHFQCYAARTAPGTEPALPEEPVTLTDQFETGTLTDISRSVFVCNPSAKTVGDDTTPIVDESGHLKCYDADDADGQPPFTGRTVSVDDQFGSWQVRVGNVSHLCEDATKEDLSSVRRSPR